MPVGARRARVIQPPQSAGIDWGNPITRGLLLLMPLGAGDHRDLVTGQKGTRTGSGGGAFKNGVNELFGASSYIDLPFVPAIGTSSPCTFAWTQEPRSTSGYSTVANINFGSGTSSFLIYEALSDSAYYFIVGPRSGATNCGVGFNSVGAVVNGTLDRYVLLVKNNVLSSTGGDYELWRNGVKQTQSNTATFGSHTGAVKRIGALDSAGDVFEGSVANFHVWGRPLDDAEAREWTTNEFITRARRRRWFGFPAGAQQYSLTAAQGSFSLTGQAAGLRADRKLSAAQGSYTLTGQPAGLLQGRALAASLGSYALSGQAAGLFAQRRLSAAQGNYALTGQAAALVKSRLLAAGQGTYALSGQDATLRATRLIAAAPASYSFSGQAATFVRGRVMPAAHGIYTLTGIAAALQATRALTAAAGTYSLTGQTATLVRGRTMPAAHGIYALAGQAAVFSLGRKLLAARGIYTYTGQAVTFSVSGGVVFTADSRTRIGGSLEHATPARLGGRRDAVAPQRIGDWRG